MKRVLRQVPVWTLLITLGSTIASLTPGMARYLIYDRSAILGGEVWRLVTGHLVHFSGGHLAYNLAAFSLAAWVLERRRDISLPALFLLSGIVISGGIFLLIPDLSFYGGLSGIVFALVVSLSLSGITAAGSGRWSSILLLSLTALKLIWELTEGRFFFVSPAPHVIPVPLSHLLGAFSGAAFFCWNDFGNLWIGRKCGWDRPMKPKTKHSPVFDVYIIITQQPSGSVLKGKGR